MAHKHTNKKGFTLVELMLAMSMLSLLLLAIAMLVMQIIKTYDKGVTLKAVDMSGRMLSADIKRSVDQSGGEDMQFIEFTDGVDKISGRLCTSKTSYAWNYPAAFKPAGDTKAAKYSDGAKVEGIVKIPGGFEMCAVADNSDRNTSPIGVSCSAGDTLCQRVIGTIPYDDGAKYKCNNLADNESTLTSKKACKTMITDYCKQASLGQSICVLPDPFATNATAVTPAKYPQFEKKDSTELLTSTDRGIIIHKFDQPQISSIGEQRIIAFAITLGTKESDTIDVSTDTCKENSDGGNETFCAINTFNFTARTGTRI